MFDGNFCGGEVFVDGLRGGGLVILRPSRHQTSKWLLGHKGQQVSFRIPQKRHPQFVIRHFGHHERLPLERNALRLQLIGCTFDIPNFVINTRPGMIVLRLVSGREHQSNPPAIEEGHVPCIEQVRKAQRVFVEIRRAGEVFRVNGDLAHGSYMRCDHEGTV